MSDDRYVHTVFMSDGTKLSEREWEELVETGEVKLGDRVLTMDREKRAREMVCLAHFRLAFKEITA